MAAIPPASIIRVNQRSNWPAGPHGIHSEGVLRIEVLQELSIAFYQTGPKYHGCLAHVPSTPCSVPRADYHCTGYQPVDMSTCAMPLPVWSVGCWAGLLGPSHSSNPARKSGGCQAVSYCKYMEATGSRARGQVVDMMHNVLKYVPGTEYSKCRSALRYQAMSRGTSKTSKGGKRGHQPPGGWALDEVGITTAFWRNMGTLDVKPSLAPWVPLWLQPNMTSHIPGPHYQRLSLCACTRLYNINTEHR